MCRNVHYGQVIFFCHNGPLACRIFFLTLDISKGVITLFLTHYLHHKIYKLERGDDGTNKTCLHVCCYDILADFKNAAPRFSAQYLVDQKKQFFFLRYKVLPSFVRAQNLILTLKAPITTAADDKF